jgi:hypothetical protein
MAPNGFEARDQDSGILFYQLQNLVSLKLSNHPGTIEKHQNLFSKITNSGNINYGMRDLNLQYIAASIPEITTNYPHLKILEIRETSLTNDDLNLIFQLKHLYKLNLDVSGSHISNNCVIDARLENLRHLTLIKGHQTIMETFIENFLKKAPNLTHLHFEFCINLNNEWIKIATENLSLLKTLKLSGFGGLRHPNLDLQFLKYIQRSKLELKLNFFLYTKFVEIFNILENLNVVCE